MELSRSVLVDDEQAPRIRRNGSDRLGRSIRRSLRAILTKVVVHLLRGFWRVHVTDSATFALQSFHVGSVFIATDCTLVFEQIGLAEDRYTHALQYVFDAVRPGT